MNTQGYIKRKVAVVTGAAGILGQEVTASLVKNNMRVCILDSNEKELHEMKSKYHNDVYPITCDLCDENSISAAADTVSHQFHHVDILVNNAGILSNHKALTTTANEWRKILAVNLDGLFLITQKIIPLMKQQGWGRIINIGSLAAKTGVITAGTAYTASKSSS